MKNIFTLFSRTVETNPGRIFLSSGHARLTYNDVYKKVKTKVNDLREQGLRPHHRLLYPSTHSVDFVVHMLASWKCGATFVPLSPDFSSRLQTKIKDVVRPFGSIDPETRPLDGLSEQCAPAVILFTSGTTSEPKGVVLTHQNILSNLDMIDAYVPDDVISFYDASFSFLPWYHSYGLVGELLFLMSRGATLHFSNERDPKKIVRQIRQSKPTLLYTVPRFLEKIKHASDNALWWVPKQLQKPILFGKNIRIMSVGGAYCSPHTITFFNDSFRIPVLQGYGLTETSPMISLTTLKDFNDGTTGSCGRPFPQLETLIHDDGELLVRGPNVTPGYLGKDNTIIRPPERFLDDNWYRTGDCVQQTDGFLYFQNRLSGLWKCANGKFIDPVHIETCLLELSCIEQAVVLQNKEQLELFVFGKGLHNNNKDTLLHEVHTHLKAHHFQSHEIPVCLHILQRPLSIRDGTLSLKFEPVRHAIQHMYTI